jgi:hypothetical protein
MNVNYTIHTVTYGKDYNPTVSQLLGTQCSFFNKKARIIDTCAHTGNGTMVAFDTWLNKETGKVIKVCKYGISYDKVLVFDNAKDYEAYKARMIEMEKDPETLR